MNDMEVINSNPLPSILAVSLKYICIGIHLTKFASTLTPIQHEPIEDTRSSQNRTKRDMAVKKGCLRERRYCPCFHSMHKC